MKTSYKIVDVSNWGIPPESGENFRWGDKVGHCYFRIGKYAVMKLKPMWFCDL